MTSHVEPQHAGSGAWRHDTRPPARLWLLVMALPILAVFAFAVFQPIQVLPRISLAPGYSLVDQDGNRLTSEDLRGSLVLYNFTYTRCGEGCPQTSQYLSRIRDELDQMDTGDIPVQFVTISFDPAHDTPDVLDGYAQDLGADTSRWRFASGEAKQLKNIIGSGFRTYYNQEEDGSFTFDPVFALVDGWGILRATYRTPQPDVELLKRDLRLVATEAQNRDGVNRYAYEAAHLFLCYP